MRKLTYLCLLILVATVSYWAFYEELPADGDDSETDWLILDKQQLEDGGIAFSKTAPGLIEQALPVYGKIAIIPDYHCHISNRVSGVVKKTIKRLGDRVQQGEAIALIESKEVAEAQAQFQMIDAKITHLQSLLDQQVKLSERNLSTDYELAQVISELNQAEIERKMIEQKLHGFGLTANMPPLYEVKAPFDGTIIKQFIAAGEAVEENKELYEIANLDNVLAAVTVYPQDIHLVELGKEIVIDNQRAASQATISYISPIIDEDTGTIAVLAKMENQNGIWRPGSKISGKLISAKMELPNCLPSQSIVMIDDIPHIFVSHEKGIEPRKVLLGHADENFTENLEGVSSDENIVVTNASLLKCELTKQEPD